MIKIPSLVGFSYTKLDYADYVTALPITGCTTVDLGACSDGVNHVYGLTLGNMDGSKPVIYIEGSIHGDHEWRCAYWVRKFLEMLASPSDYPQRNWLVTLKTKFDFYVVPCLNPYGYINTNYLNANGVNLNRNFPVGWDDYPVYPPWNIMCKGSAAFSETETQMVQTIFNTYHPVFAIDCHTWGGFENGTVELEYSGKKYDILAREINRSCRFNTGNSFLFTQYGTSEPRVGEWISTLVNSRTGLLSAAITIETGELETDTDKARLGMSSLLLACIQFAHWHETRSLTM